MEYYLFSFQSILDRNVPEGFIQTAEEVSVSLLLLSVVCLYEFNVASVTPIHHLSA
jgi:hypothetical protein